MKLILQTTTLVLFLLIKLNVVFAQDSLSVNLDTCKVFKSLEEALRKPDEVLVLNLSKESLKSFPMEVLNFPNLISLTLDKNRLSEIPNEIENLENLEILSLSKNQFTVFPVSITKLTHLKKLYIDQNDITAIPHDINKLQELEVLDMWSNDLYIVPESITELKKLKVFDLRVIQMSHDEQDRIIKLLPNTKVYFSNTCNCAH